MNKALSDYLAENLDRKISREELAVSLDISIATLNRRKQDGFSAGDVIQAARHFGLSPVKALVSCGMLSQDDVDAAAQAASIAGFSDLDIAEEMVRRVADGTASGLAHDPLDDRHPATVHQLKRDVSEGTYTLAAHTRDIQAEHEGFEEAP